MKDLWHKIAETAGARVYSIFAGMATLVLTARLLGPEGRGVVAAVTSWVGFFCTFGCLSLGQVALHRAAQNEGVTWLSKTFGALLFLAIIESGLGVLTAFGIYQLSDGAIFGHLPYWVMVIGFAMLPLQIWEQYGSSLLMAVNRLRIYNKAQIAGRTVGVIAVYAFVGLLGWGVLGALGASALGQLVVSLIGVSLLWELAGRQWQVDWGEVISLIRDGAKLYLNVVGYVLFTQCDILMLNYYWPGAQVGWYQFSSQLVNCMLIVPQAASMVFYSRMGEMGPDRLWPGQKRVCILLIGLMAASAFLAYLFAPWAIVLVAGGKFAPSVAIFRLLLPALLGMTFSALMGNQWIGRGFFLQSGFLTLSAGLLKIVLNFIFIPRYAMVGAAWVTVATYLVIPVTLNLWMAVRCDRWSRVALLTKSVSSGQST